MFLDAINKLKGSLNLDVKRFLDLILFTLITSAFPVSGDAEANEVD